MYELIKEFIKPELLVLIPVLYLVGAAVKKSNIKDSRIPYILGGVSILLCGLYVFATESTWAAQSVVLAVFTAIVQGILIAGASVYANQAIKQAGKEE